MGGNPTVPVLAGYKREEDPTHQPTHRKAVLASAISKAAVRPGGVTTSDKKIHD